MKKQNNLAYSRQFSLQQVKYGMLRHLKKNKGALIAYGISAIIVTFIHINYGLIINATGSLDNFAFFVRKGVYPTEIGQYAAFNTPKNPYYEKQFIKIVGGMGGDEVIEDNRVFYVNDRMIGRAKEVSLKGAKLDIGPVGILPKDTFFMYSPHKDSYDSRYKDIGWISKDAIIGIAYPIL